MLTSFYSKRGNTSGSSEVPWADNFWLPRSYP